MTALVVLASLCASASARSSSEGHHRAIIFCVDVSGSMRSEKLMTHLKGEMVRFVRDPDKIQSGDWFMLIAFGTQVSLVVDRRITDSNDIAHIQRVIESLQPGEAHTYVTKALDLTVTQMQKLRDAGYGAPTLAYLFTDGKNEPPPSVQNPLTFDDIVKKWTLQTKLDTSDYFVYVVTLGVTPEQGLLQVQQKFPKQIKIVERPRVPSTSEHIIPPAPVRVRYVPLFEAEISRGPRLELPVALEILDPSEYEGKTVELRLEVQPTEPVTPKRHRIKVARGARTTSTFVLKDPKPGQHTVVVRASAPDPTFRVLPASETFPLNLLPPGVRLEVEVQRPRRPVPGVKTPLSLSVLASSVRGEWDGRLQVRAQAPFGCPVEPKTRTATLKPGQPTQIPFELTSPARGHHTVTFHFTTPSGVPVSPAAFPAEMVVEPPAPWHLWLLGIVGSMLLLVVVAVLTQALFFPRFDPSWVLYGDSGQTWRLRLYQGTYRRVLSSRDLGLEDACFELLPQRGKELFARTHKEDPWRRVVMGRELCPGYRIEESAPYAAGTRPRGPGDDVATPCPEAPLDA